MVSDFGRFVPFLGKVSFRVAKGTPVSVFAPAGVSFTNAAEGFVSFLNPVHPAMQKTNATTETNIIVFFMPLTFLT